MSKNYIINNIVDFIRSVYGVKMNITEIDQYSTMFNLGDLGAFVLKTNAFNNEAELNAFKLNLAWNINKSLGFA